jgi:hypothetical protein
MTAGGVHRRRWTVAALLVALAAAAALLLWDPRRDPPAPAGPVPLAEAWPQAQRSDLPGNVPDGPVFQPGIFLDARTAIGTAPSPDGGSMRLLLRSPDGTLRELRRMPLRDNPTFDTMAAAGRVVVWTESSDAAKLQLWTVDLDAGTPRRITTDTGDAVFYGSQHDLAIADGRVHWTAASGDGKLTEIRSVPLTGGAVTVRQEPGAWALSAWPWMTDGVADRTGTTVLRDLSSNREMRVSTTGAELTTCSPVWCRVMVMSGDGLARIDVMHPDGSSRKRIAGGTAGAAVPDVAILDRFEILSETGPDSDLTGTAGLRVYDITTGRTVDVSPAVDGAFSRNGMLWWSTGDQDSIVWHTLDLRTV